MPVQGGFKAIMAVVRVNGADELASVDSDREIDLGSGVTLQFPSAKHEHDPLSGPVAVVKTPDMQVGGADV